MTLHELLERPPGVVNVGVSDFAEAIRRQGHEVVHVEWVPPRAVDPAIEQLLEELL